MLIPLAAAGAAAIVAHGAFHRNSPVFGTVVHRVRAGSVAITFDDGPNPDATPRILEVLAREGVSATFFLLGRHVERWPGIASDVAAAGHVIGNHGWHHRKLHRRGPAYVELDIGLGTQAIAEATGRAPAWFRAPHGFRNPWVNRIARAHGQRVAGWSLGVWDSDRPGADVIAQRAVEGCRSGSVLLLHDGDGYDPLGDRTQTAEALPALIRGLRDRGFGFTTL